MIGNGHPAHGSQLLPAAAAVVDDGDGADGCQLLRLLNLNRLIDLLNPLTKWNSTYVTYLGSGDGLLKEQQKNNDGQRDHHSMTGRIQGCRFAF